MEDARLKDRVLAALEWESGLDLATTGVSVVEGQVTVFGWVRTFGERQALERAIRRVRGVAALTNELEVRTAIPAHEGTSQVVSRLRCRHGNGDRFEEAGGRHPA